MKYYASKCHDVLNKRVFMPEFHAKGLMLNPNYPKVSIGNDVPYIIDSGAFQDVSDNTRLSFSAALDRQLDLEKKVGHICEKIVSYDRLVDEQLIDDRQTKKRVGEENGWAYVDETIHAAEYLSSQREDLYPRKLILSCQGTTVDQYLQCADAILDTTREGDVFGIGGFCILSKNKQYRDDYMAIIERLFPMLEKSGIDSVHIFGMSVFDVLIHTEHLAKQYGLDVSYDTSSAEVNSVFGRIFNPCARQTTGVYTKSDKYSLYHPVDLAHFNIRNVTQFWDNFESMNMTSQCENLCR